jgi:hypothetical protein
MASIKISNLNISGSDLFMDSESFLDELSSDDLAMNIKGGLTPFLAGVALSFAISNVYFSKK